MNTTLERQVVLPQLPAEPFVADRKGVVIEPGTKSATHAPVPAAPAPARKKSYLGKALLGVGLLAGAIALGTYYAHSIAPFESTDDAFIEGHVTAIAPQIAGRVISLQVKDNQAVNQGDLLLQIDPRDYQVKLDQAQANLAAARSHLEQTKAQLTVDQAKAEQEKANVTAAEAEASLAQAELKRYQSIGSRGVSQSQIDVESTKARSTAAQVAAAKNKQLAAAAQVGLTQASIQSAVADVQQNEANVRQAELNLSYTQVTAPEDGFVTRRSVETGAYVQTGQSLLAIVPHQVWVVANFKETQLVHMRPGQPVEVKVDAFPKTKFHAHVDSIQAGSGARFSLLPPENASGNYVKVVQRIPVKIVFDDDSGASHLLGPGMSVVPEVRVK